MTRKSGGRWRRPAYVPDDPRLRHTTLWALGAVVAIEPETGGILAMVSKPGYNPNTFVTGFSETEFAKLKFFLSLF